MSFIYFLIQFYYVLWLLTPLNNKILYNYYYKIGNNLVFITETISFKQKIILFSRILKVL